MKTNVITISRQFGSLGRPIGIEIAKQLGFAYYDRDILEKTAEIMDTSMDTLQELEDNGIQGYHKMAYPLGLGNGAKRDKMFEVQSEIITKLAETENCVIIGRCSDYVLRERRNVLSCYIYAPYLKRIENSVDLLNIPAAKAKKMVDEVDRSREEYYKHYTGCAYNTTFFRQLLIDSSLLGIQETAQLIADIAKQRFK